MATYLVRSTDGSNSDNGSTWALAKATTAGALAAAGDIAYLSQVHAETSAGFTLALPGTAQNPNVIAGCSDASEPPTASQTGASISTTGTGDFLITGSGNFYDVIFNCGSGFNYAKFNINGNNSNNIQRYTRCAFNVLDTHPSTLASFGSEYAGLTEFIDCTFKYLLTGQMISLHGNLNIVGGGMASGCASNASGNLSIGASTIPARLNITGFDFSNLATGAVIFQTPTAGYSGVARLKNCKLPAGWTGRLVNAAFNTVGTRLEMWNCDSGNTNYKLWIEDAGGTIRDEETVVATSGASDGTTAYSMKVSSNANVVAGGCMLVSPELLTWCDTTGASKTATVEIVHDSLTALTDAEVWVEIDYMGDSSTPLSTTAKDRVARPFGTAANQSTSTASWTTTGLANPNKQKLEVTFTPQKKGYVTARVVLAKPSKTIYVDPKLTVA